MNIKEKVNALYRIIADAEEELKTLREECSHNNKFYGHYMWAPGHIHSGLICEDCGIFIGEADKMTLMQEYNKWFNSPEFIQLPIYNEIKSYVNDYRSIVKSLNTYLNSLGEEELNQQFSVLFKIRDLADELWRL